MQFILKNRNFKVDRILSKIYGDCKTELELWKDKTPEKIKMISYQISVYIELENITDKKVEFLIQLHGDKGITSEIPFENVKSRKAESQTKYTVLFEKPFLDCFVGDIHTLVLYSKHFQYLYVHYVIVKLPEKIYK